jgi:hypothetical protein
MGKMKDHAGGNRRGLKVMDVSRQETITEIARPRLPRNCGVRRLCTTGAAS